MRRFLAYIVMMLTMICALIFNTQAVLDQKTDAMEYGSGIEMVYSLTERKKESYDLSGNTGLNDVRDEEFALDSIDIEKEVMDRLDLAGVRNASVRIVEGEKDPATGETLGSQLRIALSPLNEAELERVKQVISVTGEFAIATIGDDTVMYQNGGKFFDDSNDLASIVYNGTIPYPAIKIIPEDYDSFKTSCEEAAEAHKNDVKGANRLSANDDGSEEEEEDNSTTCFLWTNKTTSDTYDKAFGTNEVLVDEDVKAKVIAQIDLNNYDSETKKLTITSKLDGSSWDISSARAFVNMLNAKDYGFDLTYLYENSVPATFGANERGTIATYIILGVSAVLLIVVFLVFYGLAGLSASLTMLGSTLLSFLLFSLLGFEFSIASLVGLFVLMIQSVLISLNYFERTKAELKKGRDVEKANREGYHKSFFSSLDASLVLLIGSLFSFLLANGAYKTFFGVIMVGSIFTFLVTNYINKWMLYWLCKDVHTDEKFALFGRVQTKERKQHKFAHSEEHATRKMGWILPLVAVIGLGIAMPTSYLLSKDDSFFNNSADFTDTYTLNISFEGQSQQYNLLSTKENYLTYLVNIGTDSQNTDNGEGYFMIAEGEERPAEGISFTYDPDTAFVNVVEKTDDEGNTYFVHHFHVDLDTDLDELTTADGKSVQQIIYDSMNNLGVRIDEDGNEAAPVQGYSHYIDDTLTVRSNLVKPTNVAHNYCSMFLLVFLLSVFTSVYLLFRHGLSIAVTNLASGTLLAGLGTLLMILCRIPFSSFTGFGLLAAVLLFNMLSVLALGGNREILKEQGIRRTATSEQREEIANDVANRSLTLTFASSVILALLGIGLLFIDFSLLGLSLSLILFSVLSFALLYFYAVPLYHNFASHVYFVKLHDRYLKFQEKRGKKKEERVVSKDGIAYVDPDGPHETIIPGMNDFHVFR